MAPAHASSRAGQPGGDDQLISVLLPLPLKQPYTYRVPAGQTIRPGDLVDVPLGGRTVPGVVWALGAADAIDATRLRDVIRTLDAPPLPAIARSFIDWVAGYYAQPPGSILRMTLNVPAALQAPRPVIGYRLAGSPAPQVRLTAARQRVLAVLEDGPARPAADLAREAGCGKAVVRALADAGLVEAVVLPPAPPFAAPDWRRQGPALSADQASVAATLAAKVNAGDFTCTLLDGVTGSGKTEVYFEAIAAALRAGHQSLVLLPEIALSAQWLDRFAARFGAPPAVWHSELSAVRRRETWRAVAAGQARIVVGARSALFLPYPDLRLIIVDEEHEPAFKQEDGVPYHARDMAVARARLGRCPVVLVSATPSLESTINVQLGRYGRVHLPQRHGGARLPSIEAIDMRREGPPRGRFLAPRLVQGLRDALTSGEQAMLFLNRRGYAPLTLCRRCGHRLECPNCTAWLVEHRLTRRLQCHHCGYAQPPPETCPACGAEESLVACGPGVERLAEEVDAILPDARWMVATSDTLSGPSAAADVVRQMAAGELDLLIGTQVIAKGHHFPQLTLVGVVDADLGLAGGDLRAAERTFHVLHQVAGRAGRGDRPGRALLQSYQPDHPVVAALVAGDRDGFLAQEAEARRSRGLPPFGRLAALVVSGRDAVAVDQVAAALGRAAPRGNDIDVLGPAPAPLSVLRGRHRRRLLVKAARRVPLQRLIHAWLDEVRPPGSVRVAVDIDPYSFL